MKKYVLKQAKLNDAEESRAKAAVTVGATLYGYCCGFFGRDSYEDKKVISINGNHIQAKDASNCIHNGNINSWIKLVNSSNYELSKRT